MKDHQRRDKERKPGRDDFAFRQMSYWFFTLSKEVRKMSAELDRLTAEVARNTEVDDSAIALLEGLAQQIRDLAGNPAALKKLADDMDASSAKLAAAVVANTPAAEPPPEEPPVP